MTISFYVDPFWLGFALGCVGAVLALVALALATPKRGR